MTVLDLALIGGGLHNGLCALATLAARPAARIALFERESTLGGNHTWCFHDRDVDEGGRALLEPMVVRHWSGHDVAFPRRRRTLAGGYAAISSARFDEVVRARLAEAPDARVHLSAEVVEVRPGEIAVREGGALVRHRAETVIDARGPERGAGAGAGAGGFQKFVGQELRLAAPHGLVRPIVMDAAVEQRDGFRFIYVLPFERDRVLVEDTCYGDDPTLDRPAMRAGIAAYAAARGWTIAAIEREEEGVLPLPWTADVVEPAPGLVVAGYQGGWFHPVTGYSLPPAVRLARTIAAAVAAGGDPVAAVRAIVPAQRRQLRFALRLTRMMFRWFAPERRVDLLEHFYRLPEETIARFYAMDLRGRDRARIFIGRPPRGLSWRAMLTGAAAASARAAEGP